MDLWGPDVEAMRARIAVDGQTLVRHYEPLLCGVFPAGLDHPADPLGLSRLRNECTRPGKLAADATELTISAASGALRLRVLAPASPRAVLLDLHGGGGVFGSPEMNDERNARWAEELGLAVTGLDYRLAPEHPPPAALEDCAAAARWLIAHADAELGADQLLIGGDSLGAALAVAVLIELRDHGRGEHRRFSAAILECGQFDLSRTPSQFLGGSGSADPLGGEMGQAFVQLLLPGATTDQLRCPRSSPLYADLRDLPPAIFLCGTADDLIDDTLFMAARWRLAGGEVQQCIYPDAPHWPGRLASVAEHFGPRLAAFLGRHLPSVDQSLRSGNDSNRGPGPDPQHEQFICGGGLRRPGRTSSA